MLEFEWDTQKAKANESKHNVTFYEASEIFEDHYSSSVRDPDHSLEEARYLIFGVSKSGKYLVVSYAERNDRIRIISACQMTPRERKAYEQ